MESRTPYLDAIQKIPGNTAKEKHKSFNKIIQEIIKNKMQPGDYIPQTSYGSPIPARLIPLIQIEIAKILKNTNEVIKALKSEDFNIVFRALQAKWIFDGSISSVTNFSNFATNILPYVSLNTRALIIKRLSQCLGQKQQYTVAYEFFKGIRKTYNLNLAMPLLTACREENIAEVIKDGTVNLPKKIVERLFLKYPILVIGYLKLCKPKQNRERNVTFISIWAYLDFLPRLIPKYIDEFIDIVNSFENPLDIKLGNKRSELFLKGKGVEALIQFPRKYLPQLPLQLVTRKLPKDQFQLMFKNLFPKNREKFNLSKMRTYLKFQPEFMQLQLITRTFKELYAVELINCWEYVTPELLLILPSKKRVTLAQKKLAEEPDFKQYHCEEYWVVYFSTADSIPRIKDEISKSKEVEVRAFLASALIYTCKVNKSNRDLFHVLKFIASRHRNEISIFWWVVYESLLSHFDDLENLSANHWKILDKLIQRSNVKDNLMDRATTAQILLEKSVHYNLLNNEPVVEKMILLAEIKIKCWNAKFNIIVQNPKYEKFCLETFIDIIPRKYPEDNEIWKDNKVDTIHQLTAALYTYNERVIANAKKAQQILKTEELLSLSKYQWLRDQVKNIVLQENKEFQEKYKRPYKINELKKLLQTHERILYDLWFPRKEAIAHVYEQEGLTLLKKDSERILTNWKIYFVSCKRNIRNSYTKRFLKKCTWYNQIPIKFVEESLSQISEEDPRTLKILALLVQAPEFVQIIKPILPEDLKIDEDKKEAKKAFRTASSVPPAINLVNPAPPLGLVDKFLKGDYLSLGLISLMNVSRRTSVDTVINYATHLVSKPVSVKKHGIRLMCLVAPTASLHTFLRDLWRSETHISIRDIVFQHIYNLFTKQPSVESWLLMSCCIEDLTVKDLECFNTLVKIENVPNIYIKAYFEAGLTKIEKLAKEGLKPSVSDELIHSLIKKATSEVCAFFPEHYFRSLVQKFAFVCSAGRLFVLESFLIQAESEILESRLIFFCNLLSTAISKNWNRCDPRNFKFYPMRYCFNEIIKHIVASEINIRIDPRIPEAMMNLFSSPLKASNSYLKLLFVIELRKAKFDGRLFGLAIGTLMPHLISTFTGEMISVIAEVLSDFLSSLIMTPSNEGNFIGSVTEALLHDKNYYCNILAAIMVFKHHSIMPNKQYKSIVDKLLKLNNSAIETILNNHINSFSDNSIITNCRHMLDK